MTFRIASRLVSKTSMFISRFFRAARRSTALACFGFNVLVAHDALHAQSPIATMVREPLGISMDRLGAGTTWIPDAVSLPSRQYRAGTWDLMLLQTGETYRGKPLHDRQHPHDVFMELGAMYERPITSNVGVMLYAAPSGEPALGPVAFMHRPSAMDNVFAPISHHWQDATHVSIGVLTAGIFAHQWKLEGSVFNGREPDERRWNFDAVTLDSYSARVSFNPAREWALSAGYGYRKRPELLMPQESMHRVTASAMHGTSIGTDGQIATIVVWGANKHEGHPDLSHSVLVESEAVVDASNTFLMRAELVQKTSADLVLNVPPTRIASERSFNVAAMSVGYVREFERFPGATLGLGAMGTVNVVPSALSSAYGSRTPLGGVVFLRLRPTRSESMAGMAGMHHD